MFIHEGTNNLVSGAFLKCFSIYNDNETCRRTALGFQALQRAKIYVPKGALTSYARSNLVSEWKLLSLSHLTHYKPGVLYLCIENRK